MRLTLLGVALLGAAPMSAGGQSTRPELERELARIEPLSGGTLGIAATHLESGRSVFYKADEPYPLASTYKVPIAVQALTLVEQGKLDLERMVSWDTTDLHIGSEAFGRDDARCDGHAGCRVSRYRARLAVPFPVWRGAPRGLCHEHPYRLA